ncbi:hypothetical protein [Acinetobacter sp. MD2]|uniref:hypothetical protein n=1 Tax=Acinetobacter sp. MD2 TaxID=2600066 RepID=UPI002D1EA073|nr:hypothetical protein [Acinetobacter sp. MD2]MEB3767580.1 hypothetical protein [Acinetobacter sp. MD2]
MNKRLRMPVLYSALCLVTSALVGCGGSDDSSSNQSTNTVTTSASAASNAALATSLAATTASTDKTSALANSSATAPQNTVSIEGKTLDNRPKLLAASTVEGTIAKEVKAGLAVGNSMNYDVLLLDQRDALDGSNKTKIMTALNENKKVLIDLGPAGATRTARQTAVQNLVGMSVNADAIMIQNSSDKTGYIITPVEAAKPTALSTLSDTDATSNPSAPVNTTKNIFGL